MFEYYILHINNVFFSSNLKSFIVYEEVYIVRTNPCSVEVDGDEWGRDGEVVHEAVQLKHEPELVRGCYKLNKK
mgnify:CR=1 FL=1